MGLYTWDTPADIADREAQRRAREDARIEHDERERKARKEDPEEYRRDWEDDDDETTAS